MAEIEQTILKSMDLFLGFARKRLNDPELAADAVQESLLKALKAADKPTDAEKMIPWFYRILRRTLIDLYRRKATRDGAMDSFEHHLELEATAEDEKVICQCFRTLLPSLPDQYQAILQKVDLDGEPQSEVANDLKITPNNLNVRLHRARAALRKQVEDVCKSCSKHGCLNCTCEVRSSA